MIPTSVLEIRDRWRLLDSDARAALIRTVVPDRIRRSRRRPPYVRLRPRLARQDGPAGSPPTTKPGEALT